MARVTISLDDKLKSQLEKEASNLNRSISSLTAHIIENYFTKKLEDKEIQQEIKSLKSQIQTLSDEMKILKSKVDESSEQSVSLPSDMRGWLIQRYPEIKSQIQRMTDEDVKNFLLEEGIIGDDKETNEDQLKITISKLSERFDKLEKANDNIENEIRELASSINKLLDG